MAGKKVLVVGFDPKVVDFAAPGARICFSTTPKDSAEAIRRWV